MLLIFFKKYNILRIKQIIIWTHNILLKVLNKDLRRLMSKLIIKLTLILSLPHISFQTRWSKQIPSWIHSQRKVLHPHQLFFCWTDRLGASPKRILSGCCSCTAFNLNDLRNALNYPRIQHQGLSSGLLWSHRIGLGNRL